MKPLAHAKNSAKKYGGHPDDYMEVHNLMDSSKAAHASMKHRMVYHSAFGIFIVEQILGTTMINSAGRVVNIRDLAEDHVLEDLGRIPSLDDWVRNMPLEPWMMGSQRGGRKGYRRIK